MFCCKKADDLTMTFLFAKGTSVYIAAFPLGTFPLVKMLRRPGSISILDNYLMFGKTLIEVKMETLKTHEFPLGEI